MTIVVLLILVMVWAVVLGPSLLRRRAERRSSDSIGDFHRQLRILQRTGPVVVDPANRLQGEDPDGAGVFRVAGTRGTFAAQRRPDPYFRPDACRRRRQVLLVLVGVLVGTGLFGAIPALRPMLFVTIAGAVALAAYVGLLVYLRMLAMEREVKLHYLPERSEAQPSVVRRVAAR